MFTAYKLFVIMVIFDILLKAVCCKKQNIQFNKQLELTIKRNKVVINTFKLKKTTY